MPCIDLDVMGRLANEDFLAEFVPVNLGHWDSVDLRKMAESVGLKALYIKHYAYTSGFMHGSWGAVRETVYINCCNSLHRFHRIPQPAFPMISDVTSDAVAILNDILKCLSQAYPTFEACVTTYDKNL